MYDDLIVLVDETETGEKDNYGDKIIQEVRKEVLAQRMSIGMKEFYQAQTDGMKPEIKFKLADCYDYDNQKIVDYEGFRYKVLRTYQSGNELEITCYGGVRKNASTTVSSKD